MITPDPPDMSGRGGPPNGGPGSGSSCSPGGPPKGPGPKGPGGGPPNGPGPGRPGGPARSLRRGSPGPRTRSPCLHSMVTTARLPARPMDENQRARSGGQPTAGVPYDSGGPNPSTGPAPPA